MAIADPIPPSHREAFLSIFEHMPVGVGCTSLEGTWLLVNPRLCEILQYPREELEQSTYLDTVLAEDRVWGRSYAQRLLTGEITSATFEERFLRKDGSTLWANVIAMLVYHPAGEPAYFALIINDIEMSKQREQRKNAQFASEVEARELAENLNEQMQVLQILTDHALAHLSLDDFLQSVLSRIRSIMAADNIAILLLTEDRTCLTVRAVDGIEKEVAPHVRIPVGKGFAGRVAACGKPVIIAEEQMPAEIITPVLREELHALLGIPLQVNGRLLGVIHIGTKRLRTFTQEDINLFERVADRLALGIEHALLDEQSKEALAQAEEMNQHLQILQAITDTALTRLSLDDLFSEVLHRVNEIMVADTTAILLLTEDGKYLAVRAAKGLEEEVKQNIHVPIGYGFAGHVASERRPWVVPDISQIEVASQILRENVYSLMGVPLLINDKIIGVIHIGTRKKRYFTEKDIEIFQRVADRIARAIDYASLYQAEKDAREQAVAHARQLEAINEELAYANKVQRDFISIIGHELRTPLAGIQGFGELLREGGWSEEEIKEFASDICVDAQRLNRIISELLDLERMRSGRMKLNVKTVELNVLLSEIVTRVRASSHNCTLRLELDGRITQIRVDEDKLTQVIMNLLSNAIKYSPNAGEILVRDQLEEGKVHIQVQDHGIGIPAHEMKNLFTPFYRIESNSTQYIQGTGLGLSIVKELIELHKGTVWAESTSGQGSTFHILLPL